MKKVLIISYFFPPSNFVGGERAAAWTKHLSENGIYPIIITRNWNENQNDLINLLHSNKYSVEKTDQYEIHRMPYKRSIRDRLSSYKWLSVLQKALTLKELIFSNFSIKSLPYYNFYLEAKNIIIADPEIKAVIVSGRPFQSFFIGYKLKKEFDLLWIPDYRDEWTTHKHIEKDGLLKQWINRLEQKSEIKWTSNADFFISVSDNWIKSINKLTGIEGKTVHNGYNQFSLPERIKTNSNKLIITYAGTLYESQNVELIIDSCIELLDSGNDILLRFIGTHISNQRLKQIQEKTKGQEDHFVFLERMPKDKLEDFINSTDLLMLTGFSDITGWYPVKLFEYYASGKPILLYPTDDDVMEEFVVKSNSGFTPKNQKECKRILETFIKNKKKGDSIICERNTEYGNQFSREEQTKKLADIINNL